ncbi:uncharacterized protein LOC123722745 isoform X2 [Papilio machaon]|uniref:uncharacterized protein LOC123722745 isoform X2 n=1 Tax=Papilio machaon TaxID=76193 RepID=UPI001E664822|nr:uncharacterized protein LOC123722745 isoform X2 [Papilio machaon]
METLQMGEELSGDVDDNNIKDEKEPHSYNGYENGRFNIQLLDFSDDVLLIILRNLSPSDLKALGFTCMRFASLVLERSLWRKVDARGQPCGTARFKWLLNAIHRDTTSLMLTGYAGQNDGVVSTPSWPDEPRNEAWELVAEDFIPAEKDQKPGKCTGPRFTFTGAMYFKLIEKCPKLTTLILEYCNINCRTIQLSHLPPTLKTLSLKGAKCFNLLMDRSFLFKIQDALPYLETLDFSECDWLDPSSFLPLSKLRALTRLRLRDCPRLSEFVAYSSLASRYGFRVLQELDLRGCPVGDSEVSSLSWLPELRVLQLASHRPASAPGHRHHRLARAPSAVTLQQWEIEEPEFFKQKYLVERETDGAELKDYVDPYTYTDSDSDDIETDENCTAFLTKKRQDKEKKTKKRKQEDGSGDADVNRDAPSCSKSRKTDDTKDGDKKKDRKKGKGKTSKKDSDSDSDDSNTEVVPNGSKEESPKEEHKVNGKRKSKRIEAREKKERDSEGKEVNDGASTSWERSRHVRGFICLRRNRDPEEDENPVHRAVYVNFNAPANVESRPNNFPSVFSDQITFLNPPGRLQTVALVTDSSVRQFGRADGENITYVNFGPNGPVRFEGVSPARPARSNLRSLSMVGYTNITDRSLVHLATAAPFLEFIDFRGTRVTAEGVQNFLLERPDCKVLYGKVED